MHGARGQRRDVGDVHADGAGTDEVEDVGGIVEDGEARGDEHGVGPGFELEDLGVGGVLVEREDVVAEDFPEDVGDGSPEGGTMEETTDAAVAVDVAPDAGAEPR